MDSLKRISSMIPVTAVPKVLEEGLTVADRYT